MDYQELTYAVAGQGQIPPDKALAAKKMVQDEIEDAIQHGYKYFILGLSGPSSVSYGEAILSAIDGRDGISLEVYIAYPGWIKDCASEHEKAISAFLQDTHGVNYAAQIFVPDLEVALHNALLDLSGRILVIHDGKDDECITLIQNAKESETPVKEMLMR